MRWLPLALCAPLALAVKPRTPSDVVTCTDITVSENLFANPSWEDGKQGWEYDFGALTTNAFATDGSYSVYGHSERVSGRSPEQANWNVDMIQAKLRHGTSSRTCKASCLVKHTKCPLTCYLT